MNSEHLGKKIDELKKLMETLVLIDVARSGATRSQARKALGSLDNNAYSKISRLFNGSKSKK